MILFLQQRNNSEIFIDVGANIEFYSILLSMIKSFDQIYSLNGYINRNFLVLIKNIDKNKLKKY